MPKLIRHSSRPKIALAPYAERLIREQVSPERSGVTTAMNRRYHGHMSLRPFHLAFPVHDLAAARAFYGGVMGCPEGRSADSWIDFDLFGHQIVTHLDPAAKPVAVANPVDGHDVPVPHVGVVLTMPDWEKLAARVEAAGVRFGIAPHIRFRGQPGEQATMFFLDPSGNALEFKAFADDAMLFAT
jgi:extradiol dioxygenase family protein